MREEGTTSLKNRSLVLLNLITQPEAKICHELIDACISCRLLGCSSSFSPVDTLSVLYCINISLLDSYCITVRVNQPAGPQRRAEKRLVTGVVLFSYDIYSRFTGDIGVIVP